MTDTMGSYAIAMGDICEALRTAKRKTDEALEIYTSELAKQAHDLSLRETEVYKRETEVYKRETALAKRDYAELANPALPVLDAEIKAKKVEVSGVGYVTYPKESVDEITGVITHLVEHVAAGRYMASEIPGRLDCVLKFLNSYKVNALEEVPGAKPKESGEGYITYRKEYVDYLMDVLGDFVTRFENLDVPTWSEQLAHALALLRKDSKVRVTDWEEYKFQWRNGRERLKSTKLQQTLRTEDGEESAKRCGRLQWLGNIADAGGTMSSN